MVKRTVANTVSARQRDSIADVRPQMLKVDLATQLSASPLRTLTHDAIKAAHGKMETAAAVLGKHHAHVGRLVNDGDLKLKDLEELGPETLAALGKRLYEHYGELQTPKARAHQKITEARAALDELQQLLEFIA